jgi:hypothetical protein
LLTTDFAVLVSVVDLVVVLVPATLAWGAVLTQDLLRAFGTIIVTTSSVNGTSLIRGLVLVHPLKCVVCLTTMATIIARAGNENLRSDVNVWPGSLSSDLNSIGHG